LRRSGFIAGRGGAEFWNSSIPFLSDAPVGKSTVSMTDVVDIRRGSPISDFWIDLLRDADRPRFVIELGGGFEGKLWATGVELPDIGGVAILPLLANGTGEARAEEIPIAGLRGKPGEGRGEWVGDMTALLWIGSRGDEVAEDALNGLCNGCGGYNPFDSK